MHTTVTELPSYIEGRPSHTLKNIDEEKVSPPVTLRPTTKKPNNKYTKKPSQKTTVASQISYSNPFPSHNGECPWREKGSKDGDCGKKFKDRCSLKYFRICGEDFFNYIYDDVCRWQDALQL